MDPREIVDAYLQGRIESWGVFRKLVRMGLSTATALAVASALPAAVNAQSADVLGQIEPTGQELSVLDLFVSHLAAQLEKVEAGGPIRPLATTLARIGGNNNNLLDCINKQECDPIDVKYNDGFNHLNGVLVPEPTKGNVMLNLNGSIGQSNVNLLAAFDSPRDPASSCPSDSPCGRNLNIGKVNMNVVGNVGNTNLNLNGNLGNLNNIQIGDNPNLRNK